MAIAQNYSSGANNQNLSTVCLTFFRCKKTQARPNGMPPSSYTVLRNSVQTWSETWNSKNFEGNFFLVGGYLSLVMWKAEREKIPKWLLSLTCTWTSWKMALSTETASPEGRATHRLWGEKRRQVSTKGILAQPSRHSPKTGLISYSGNHNIHVQQEVKNTVPFLKLISSLPPLPGWLWVPVPKGYFYFLK